MKFPRIPMSTLNLGVAGPFMAVTFQTTAAHGGSKYILHMMICVQQAGIRSMDE